MYWFAILLTGALFGLGLSVSAMIKPEVVLSFLNFNDFGLLLVLGCATGVTFITYQLYPRLVKKPLLSDQFKKRPDDTMKRTLTGAVIFGIGWGISGVCPGPAIAGLGTGDWQLLFALVSMLIGAYIQGRWFAGSAK
jgi:uncharacterized membrane protein YedE/YeeE